MSSINWLGFSLYPQDHQDISASAVNCYDLMTATSNPSEHHPLNLPSSFGVLEAFNRDTAQSQLDWNLKASTPACSQLEPKLENFLGNSSHSTSFYDDHQHTTSNGDYMFSNGALDQPNITRPQSTLSLSMTTSNGEGNNISNKQQIITVSSGISKQTTGAIESAVPKKSIDTFGQRTSIYRGVTRHRWTGRYEAHLWDNSCRREGQTRKGRQVYLGGYDKEDKAARSYDLAALKYWGSTTTTNFPISNYEKEIDEMKHMTRQEYVASLRRKSSGFSRGASIYRGVTRHHQHGRWQARIGRVAGNKDLYLGTFSTQEEAAEAYDIAAIKFRGLNAVTNFEINRYDVKAILESSSLPIGGAAKRLKEVEDLTAAAAQKIKSQTLMNIELQYYQHQYNQQQTRFKQEFQDHVHQQLQLGNTHNLMGLDNSINIYGEGGYNHYQLMPTPTATPASSFLGQNIGNHQVNDGLLLMENENMSCYNWISTVMPTRNAPPPFTVWNTDT